MSDDPTIDRIRGAKVAHEPFAHAVIDGFLEPGLFRALRRTYPDPEGMRDVRVRQPAERYREGRLYANAADLASTVDAETGDRPFERLLAMVKSKPFLRASLGLFAEAVEDATASYAGKVRIWPGQIDVISDRSGFALPPHTDGRAKLVTVLIYVADEGDPPEHGTRLYRPRRPDLRCETGGAAYPFEEFVEAAVAPYRPNTALLFARSPVSFHGVAETASAIPRRVLQFSLLHGAEPAA